MSSNRVEVSPHDFSGDAFGWFVTVQCGSQWGSRAIFRGEEAAHGAAKDLFEVQTQEEALAIFRLWQRRDYAGTNA